MTMFSTLDTNSGSWKLDICKIIEAGPPWHQIMACFNSFIWHQIEKRTSYISIWNGFYSVHSPIEADVDVLGRHCDIFEEAGTTHQTSLAIFGATFRRWHHRKMKKCELLSNTINCMGLVMATARLVVSQHTLDALWVLKTSPNISKLLFALSFCIVFQRSMPYFARFTALQNRKLQENEPTHFESLIDDALVGLLILWHGCKTMVFCKCSRWMDVKQVYFWQTNWKFTLVLLVLHY